MSSARIFINYRRADSGGWAGRLHADLAARFSGDHVFRDVVTRPGVDFHRHIEEVMDACQVCIVMIGPRWATMTDDRGQRRLDDPDDLVRLEIERALQRNDVEVIPVLVDGARMPAAADLPASLRPLVRHNASELTDRRWDFDVGTLTEHLRSVLRVSSPSLQRLDPPPKVAEPPPRLPALPAALATLAAVAVAAWFAATATDPLSGRGTPEWGRLVGYAIERGAIWAIVGAVAAVVTAVAFAQARAPIGRALVGAGAGWLGGAAGGAAFMALKFFANMPDADWLLRFASIAAPGLLIGLVLAHTAGASRLECALGALAGAVLAAFMGGAEKEVLLPLHAVIVLGAVTAVIAAPPHPGLLGGPLRSGQAAG